MFRGNEVSLSPAAFLDLLFVPVPVRLEAFLAAVRENGVGGPGKGQEENGQKIEERDETRWRGHRGKGG